MIPALFDVGHRAYQAGAVDDLGVPTDEWAAPAAKKFVTWSSSPSETTTSEPAVAGHDRDVIECGIIVYPDFGDVKPRDRMVIDSTEYDVIGHPIRNDKAWFATEVLHWVIQLKAVNG